jgi:putative NADH-flavin reductase
MKIALIGATRGTGKHVLDQALERGHEVTVLVRDPSKLQAGPKLQVVQEMGETSRTSRRPSRGRTRSSPALARPS